MVKVMKSISLPRQSVRKTDKLDSIVISTRVRLARNLEGRKFPAHLSDKDRFDIEEKLAELLNKMPDECDIEIENLDDLHRDTIMGMVSNNVLTDEFIRSGRRLAFENSGDWVLLFNEDDHIRIFGMEYGCQIKRIHSRISEVADWIEEEADFAFDETWGYLTTSILNMGSGLRISTMLNLYGLMAKQRIEAVSEIASSMGYSLLNLTGESSDCGLFFLFNIYSLGLAEKEMINEYKDLLTRIYELEMAAREELFSESDERELSVEEIFELSTRSSLKYDELLYYVALIDAMRHRVVNYSNRMDFRRLIFETRESYMTYRRFVENEDHDRIRMDLLREPLNLLNFKKTVH